MWVQYNKRIHIVQEFLNIEFERYQKYILCPNDASKCLASTIKQEENICWFDLNIHVLINS